MGKKEKWDCFFCVSRQIVFFSDTYSLFSISLCSLCMLGVEHVGIFCQRHCVFFISFYFFILFGSLHVFTAWSGSVVCVFLSSEFASRFVFNSSFSVVHVELNTILFLLSVIIVLGISPILQQQQPIQQCFWKSDVESQLPQRKAFWATFDCSEYCSWRLRHQCVHVCEWLAPWT